MDLLAEFITFNVQCLVKWSRACCWLNAQNFLSSRTACAPSAFLFDKEFKMSLNNIIKRFGQDQLKVLPKNVPAYPLKQNKTISNYSQSRLLSA